MDFEYDALKAAHRTAALITNPVGKPMNVSLDTLICSRGFAVHNRAVEILGAMNKGWIPGSADRDAPFANPISGGVPTYKIVALPWITSNTAFWWMMDSSMKGSKYGLQYKESQPKLNGLYKPSLINGETLNNIKTTLTKLVNAITLQVQRLSERAFMPISMNGAIVRPMAI